MLYCAGVLGRLFPFAFAWREAAAADCGSVEYASSSYDHGVDGESRRRVLKLRKMICCSWTVAAMMIYSYSYFYCVNDTLYRCRVKNLFPRLFTLFSHLSYLHINDPKRKPMPTYLPTFCNFELGREIILVCLVSLSDNSCILSISYTLSIDLSDTSIHPSSSSSKKHPRKSALKQGNHTQKGERRQEWH